MKRRSKHQKYRLADDSKREGVKSLGSAEESANNIWRHDEGWDFQCSLTFLWLQRNMIRLSNKYPLVFCKYLQWKHTSTFWSVMVLSFWDPILLLNSKTEKVSPEGVFSPCDNQGCSSAQIQQTSRITLSQVRCVEFCCAKGGAILLQTCKSPPRPKINFLANKIMIKYLVKSSGIQTSPLTRMPYKPKWELLSENADSRKLNCFAEMSTFWWKVTTGTTLSKDLPSLFLLSHPVLGFEDLFILLLESLEMLSSIQSFTGFWLPGTRNFRAVTSSPPPPH